MRFYKGIGVLAALTVGATALGACSGEANDPTQQSADNSGKRELGSVGMAITLPDDSVVSSVTYNITGPAGYSRTGSVPVGDSTVLTFRIGGLPVGNGYAIALSSTTSFGNSCMGSASFNVLNNATTRVSVLLVCGAQDTVGDIIIDGEFQSCPVVTSVGAIPGETRVGSTIALSSAISHGTTPVRWSGAGGTFSDVNSYAPTFTCGAVGPHTLTVAVNHADAACTSTSTVDVICAAAAGCGNGLPDLGEQCDDGNAVNTDACTNTCRTAVCGDGIDGPAPEECDDGNGVDADACSNTCLANVCGNSRVDAGEACDGTPDCNASCQLLRCGDGAVSGTEQCDDGNTVNTDACTNACTTARCGDGVAQATVEACDDGNTVAGDGCENDCSLTPSAGGDIPNQLAACRACRATNCGESYQGLGFDFVGNCFNDALHGGDPTFIQQCIDLKNCAFTNDCGYNANGMTECFCGTVDLGGCQVEGAANGPCRPQIFAAARTTVLAEVIGNFGVVALPIGVANYLQQCDFESCAACTP